jgi:hypothetical protein
MVSLRPGGKSRGEGDLNYFLNVPLILTFSRREKGKDFSAAYSSKTYISHRDRDTMRFQHDPF